MTSFDRLRTLSVLGRWDSTDPAEGELYPAISSVREPLDKLSTLGKGTSYDTCGWSSSKQVGMDDLILQSSRSGIYRASMPRGSCMLFKTLYTNVCYFDCKYCINSVHGRMTYSYAPEGLAKLFHLL